MVKKSRLFAIFLTVIAITTGCGRDGTDESIGEEKASEEGATTEETTAAFPEELSQIPEEYFEESERPGTLVELEYDTYESMSYEEQEGGTHSGEYAIFLQRIVLDLAVGFLFCNLFKKWMQGGFSEHE